jgi:hypothetical protein
MARNYILVVSQRVAATVCLHKLVSPLLNIREIAAISALDWEGLTALLYSINYNRGVEYNIVIATALFNTMASRRRGDLYILIA